MGKLGPRLGVLLLMAALLAACTPATPVLFEAPTQQTAPRWGSAEQTVAADPMDCKPPTYQPPATAPKTPYLFGVVNDDGDHFADEWAHGVRATTFELQWRRYEPQEGVYDTGYVNSMKERLAELKAQGWYVQLVPGYHYAPAWLFERYPDLYYVNQYGERYDPDPALEASSRVINAPFNAQARSLIAGYLARVFDDFDAVDFDSVRVGGGVQGELRYPPPDWNGQSNAYWAFDAHAQNPAESGIPADVVGWRPGIDPNPGSVGRGQLIVNSGFEQSDPFAAVSGWSPDDEITVERVTEEAHSGTHALKVSICLPHRVHQFIRVAPETTYTFGGWLKAGEGASRARMFVNQYNAQWQLVAGASFGKVDTGQKEWVELTNSLTTSPTTHFLKIELDGDGPGDYFFDDLWLQRVGASDGRDRDITVPLAFYDWYVQAMTDYQNWQIATIRTFYDGQLDVLYAGKGLRAHQVTDALTNDLRGDGWSEASSALYSAAVYGRHVAGLPATAGLALYLTGIEEPPAELVDDASPYAGRWSAARWLAYLAASRDLPVWGENGGQNDTGELALSASRMHANGFLGLMWAFESELYADPNPQGYASMDDYAATIAIYADLYRAYLALIIQQNGWPLAPMSR